MMINSHKIFTSCIAEEMLIQNILV